MSFGPGVSCLYADGTSVLVTNYDSDDYEKALKKIFLDINDWFNSDLLYLNYDKTSTVMPRLTKIIRSEIFVSRNFSLSRT